MSSVFDAICRRAEWCRRDVLIALLELAIEIAREGREGRRVGTLFTLGRPDAVLAHSRPLILDPLAGHVPHATHVLDQNLRGTVKELAQLDGAFVVSEEGVVRAACRYLDASVENIDLPLGLGSRHLAAASVSKRLGVVAIVVSETAVVRVFHGGDLIVEIIPELWLLGRQVPTLRGSVTERHEGDMTIFTSNNSASDRTVGQRSDRIDEELEATFPASDPLSASPVTGVRVRSE
jgi:diadenylate cyclase